MDRFQDNFLIFQKNTKLTVLVLALSELFVNSKPSLPLAVPRNLATDQTPNISETKSSY